MLLSPLYIRPLTARRSSRSRGESRDRLFGGLGSRPDTGVVRRALDTVDALMKLDLPPGVDVEIKAFGREHTGK